MEVEGTVFPSLLTSQSLWFCILQEAGVPACNVNLEDRSHMFSAAVVHIGKTPAKLKINSVFVHYRKQMNVQWQCLHTVDHTIM